MPVSLRYKGTASIESSTAAAGVRSHVNDSYGAMRTVGSEYGKAIVPRLPSGNMAAMTRAIGSIVSTRAGGEAEVWVAGSLFAGSLVAGSLVMRSLVMVWQGTLDVVAGNFGEKSDQNVFGEFGARKFVASWRFVERPK